MRTSTAWISLPSRSEKPRSRRYLHLETGVEVEKNTFGWGVGVPGKPGPQSPAGTVTQNGHYEHKTKDAAIKAAETHVIPRVREIIAKAYDAAVWDQTGTPEEWTEGQADEKTVLARQFAAHRSGRRTGRDAKQGDLVRHIETGAVGVFDRYEGGGAAYARFAFDAETALVHSADIVVLEGWLSCNRIDLADHDEHGQAVTAECLTALPDAELEGPELTAVREDREYTAADGVKVTLNTDGRWWAYGPAVSGLGVDSICSSQDTLAATYRWINRWRRTRNAQDRILTAYAQLTGWRSTQVRLADLYFHDQLAGVDREDFQWAIIRLWSERMATLAEITEGAIAGSDTVAAVTPSNNAPQHLLTVSSGLLSTWSETRKVHPAVDGRSVYWRWHGNEEKLTYRDTDRPVDEPMPTYVIVQAIVDPVAYADFSESWADGTIARRDPRLRETVLAEAAEVRAGRRPLREVVDGSACFDVADGWRYAASLNHNMMRSARGLTYELAPVTGTGSCEHCHHPVIKTDGAWRHLTTRYPIDCGDTFDGEPHTAAPRTPHRPIDKPADPPSAAPGALAYAEDGGEHVWLLGGFGCNTELAGWEISKAKLWAADAIAAGDVDGLPAGMHVVGWTHHNTDGAEWATPLLGTGPGPATPDRDRDHRDRNRPAATPASIAHKIARMVPVRDGITQIGTGTTPATATETTATAGTGTIPAPAGRTETGIHYLIETRTGTNEWATVQTGTAPLAVAVPGPGDLESLADTIKGNVGFSIGTGTASPDRPVRISTWVGNLPPAVLIVEPAHA